MSAPLLPDMEELARFSGAMFKRANPERVVALRAFDETKDVRPLFAEPISLGHPQFREVVYERTHQAANRDKPAVFCPPVVTFRNGKNAKADNVLEGVALSVDCDKAPNAALAVLKEILGDPTVVVASGGEWENPDTGEVEQKVHIHWRLKTPTTSSAEHERLREARALATKLVGGDATAITLVHPLRWPGSWHRKKDPPRLATCIFESENEIDLADALGHLREAAGASSLDRAPGIVPSIAPSQLVAANVEDVASALKLIPNEDLEWSDWNNIGLATWGATDGSEEGFRAFAVWSAKASKNDPETTRKRWEHYGRSPPNRIGFGTLVHHARQHNPLWTPRGCSVTHSVEQHVDPVEHADPVDLWAKFDPPTLPRGVLPDVIERYAFDQGMAMGADMAGFAMAALAVCAAAIPDEIKLQVKRHNKGWMESARLWVALVGPPSSMKSPIMSAAVWPLRRIDADLARQHADERAQYDRLPKEERANTDPPKHTRVLLQDTTIEAAQEVLKDSPDGVLCYQDEMSGWFGSMEKYSGSRASAKDRAFWLEAFNGAPYTVNRIGRGSIFIEHLSASLLGGIQPEPIRQIADESVDDGLLQRILPIILKPAVEGRDEEASPAITEYANLIGRLHHLNNPMLMEGLLQDPLRFDDGAQAYRQQLERKHLELCQSLEGVNRKLAAHIGKYNGIFARLCIIWHCAESDRGHLPAIIQEKTARRVGAFLHGFLLPHALAFHAGVLGLSNAHDQLTAVAGHILAHNLERLTNRDIQRGNRTMRGLDRREIESIFDQLDALGWIDRVAGPKPTTPPHWIVNPVVHTKFAQRAKAETEWRARDRKLIADVLGRGAPR